MKKLLALLCLMFAVGCTDIDYYQMNGLKVSPSLLASYNVVVQRDWHGVCGSAVIKSDETETLILTAAHCVDFDWGTYSIVTNDGQEHDAEIIKREYIATDLALLRTYQPIPVQPATTPAFAEPAATTEAWTVGFGGGEPDAFSYGIVSKVYVIDHYDKLANQFDMTIWYGNSGGGVYNADGRLIGIVSQFGPQGGAMQGWMYACPVSAIRRFLAED